MRHGPWIAALPLAVACGLPALGPPSRAADPETLEARIIEVAEQVKPTVVHIEAIVRVNDRRKSVSGSGLIASADGRILTNHHVVEKAEKVTVGVPGVKRRYPARVIGTDRQTDIALLRIEPDHPLSAARFAPSDSLRVGQWVLAIGNPYGLDGTVSLGIVSAIGRNLEIPDLLNDFIQTDAMIDRGSSGGPLVDLQGRVVGLNSRGQGRGIGFTIPIDTVQNVMAQLEQGGIERGYLGITMQALDRDLADYLGVPTETGIVVNSVVDDSPADRAGLEAGDLITHFRGAAIEAEQDEDLGILQRMVAAVSPGEEVALRTIRDGKPRELEIEIGTQPTVEPDEAESDLGFYVQEITANLARAHRLATESGAWVYFVERGSPASEAGLLIGDVIQRIEDREIEDLSDFREAMDAVASLPRFLITSRRGEETRFVLVKRVGAPSTPTGPKRDPGQASRGDEAPTR